MFLADTINTVTIILVECRHNPIMFLAIRFLEAVGMAIKDTIKEGAILLLVLLLVLVLLKHLVEEMDIVIIPILLTLVVPVVTITVIEIIKVMDGRYLVQEWVP
jgi:hypothetical protein